VREIQEQQELPRVVWDESVLEKPESLKAERVWAERSSKAQRLERIKPGFFNPPGRRPIFVPGFNWLQIRVMGRQGPPTRAHVRWWTTRGDHKSTKREKEIRVLRKIDALWGKQVSHIWDRGFAGNPWLTVAFVHATQFGMRWPKNYTLLDENGASRTPGASSQGKRSWEHRRLWDARRRGERQVGIIAFPVFDTIQHQSLWLVVARRTHQSPWYLLPPPTSHAADEAWHVVPADARRGQVEMTIRYAKSELAFASPRLGHWQHRKKLRLIATLAYAFLLTLLNPSFDKLRKWLLRTFCHRRGERSRKIPAPLYRLRLALSLFWLFHPPTLALSFMRFWVLHVLAQAGTTGVIPFSNSFGG